MKAERYMAGLEKLVAKWRGQAREAARRADEARTIRERVRLKQAGKALTFCADELMGALLEEGGKG